MIILGKIRHDQSRPGTWSVVLNTEEYYCYYLLVRTEYLKEAIILIIMLHLRLMLNLDRLTSCRVLEFPPAA